MRRVARIADDPVSFVVAVDRLFIDGRSADGDLERLVRS